MKKTIMILLSMFVLAGCNQFGENTNISLSSNKNPSVDSSKKETSMNIEEEIAEWEKKGYICENNLVYSNEYDDRNEYLVVGYYGKPKNIVIPEYFNGLPVTLIKFAFAGCDSLETIFISKNIKSISEGSFYDCVSLKEIVIDDNNPSFFMDNGLLYQRSSDEQLALIVSLSTVKGKVTLLDETVYISHYAFSSYPKIDELYLGKNINYISGYATFNGLDNLNYIEIEEDNNEYTTIDGVLFTKDLSTLVFISPTRHISYEIPEPVTAIGASFEKCTKLKNLTINKNLSSTNLLYCRTYENIYVNEDNANFASVDGILYSKDLKEVLLVPPMKVNPVLLDSVEAIATYAFLENINEKIILPESIITIGDLACFGYKGKEITIGKNLKKIGTYAFDGAVNLETVNYKGSQKEFSQIEILEGNDLFLNANIVYNYK